MKTYNYSVSTNTIWTSFDYGEVEAENYDEALKKAKAKLDEDFQKAYNILITIGFSIDYNDDDIQLNEAP